MNLPCPSCASTNPDDATFCGECGTPLTSDVLCSSCGRHNRPGLKFCHDCGTRLPSKTAILVPPPLVETIPTTIAAARYHILRLLGEGASKRVYLAHDTLLNREVALALFKLETLDQTARLRIQREARTLGQLGGHPHVVTIYDVGEDGDRTYLVSQYLSGGSLKDLIHAAPQRRLLMARALEIAIQLAQALVHAHQHGILHRDLKPGNVWFTEDGVVKLGDFGLATSLEQSRLSMEGVLVGTAAYLAPEQLEGKRFGIYSDLYAFGIMLYEMLTGRPPFVGDTLVSVIAQHLNARPVAPSQHVADVPAALEALILHLLAKAPEDRPKDAAALYAALQAIPTVSTSAAPRPQALRRTLDRLANEIFVGRDQEMDSLREHLEAVLTGQGRSTVLLGEPGLGKTRMATEFATYARLRGVRVAIGRGVETSGAPPFWPWVQIMRTYIAEQTPELLQAELGASAAVIAHVMPDVRASLPQPLPVPPELAPEQTRLRFFEHMSQFLLATSRRRALVLLFDDLQWADVSSLALLQFLAREMHASRLLLLATCRDGASAAVPAVAQTLAALTQSPNGQAFALRRLTDTEVARFIEFTTGQPPTPVIADTVYRQTEGHPFFMTEIVRLLVSEGQDATLSQQNAGLTRLPRSVRSVIERRLAHVSEDCRRVLMVASVIGREFEREMLEHIATEGALAAMTATLDALLDEAVATRLIAPTTPHAQQYSFSHTLLRDTLYETLSVSERIALQQRIATTIERLHSAHLEPHVADLAHRFCLAAQYGEDVEKAVAYAQRAGEQALSALAYEEAVSHYQRALQVLELKAPDEGVRGDLLLALGEAQHRAGYTAQARDTFLQAANLARLRAASEPFARAVLGVAGELLVPGESDHTLVRLLEEALQTLPEVDSTLRARVLGRLAMELYHSPSHERRVALSAQAVAMARRLDDLPTLTSVLSTRHYAMWAPEYLSERRALADERVTLGERFAAKEPLLLGHHWRVTDCLEAGDPEGMTTAIITHVRLAEELRQRFHQWYSVIFQAMTALLTGKFNEAEALTQHALGIGQQAQLPVATMMFGVQTFLLRREQGRLEELEPMLRQFAERSPAFVVMRYMLAYCYAELEREAEARRHFHPLAVSRFADLPRDSTWLISLGYAAEVSHFLQDAVSAALIYDWLLPYAKHCLVVGRATICYGSVSRHLGLLATTLGRWAEADTHFTHAAEQHERLGARPLLARTHYNHATMLHACNQSNDRERAAVLLAQALARAQELGMSGLEEKIKNQSLVVSNQYSVSSSAKKAEDGRQEASSSSFSQVPSPQSPTLSPQRSCLRYENVSWVIAYQGKVTRLKDLNGLHYLKYLLQHPHQEVPAIDLVQIAANSPAAATATATEHSAAAVERARVNVTRAIKATLKKVTEQNQALGSYLSGTIKTGLLCSYIPDPHEPMNWEF